MKITRVQSPNYNQRQVPVDMLMLHYTGMETGEAALKRLCDPEAAVSAHYMVWEDGQVTQLVDEEKRAWHAGVGSWQGDTDLNSHSVGIEIVNGGHNVPLADGSLPPYPKEQIESVIELSRDIIGRHAIPRSRIVGHSDVSPGRKIDPGEHFPWQRLAEHGLGIWPEAPSGDEMMGAGFGPRYEGDAVLLFKETLASIGYDIEATGTYDKVTETVVAAFQRRWQPDRVTGQAGWKTIATAVAVADQFAAEAKNPSS
ncbi:MAG: N-acetylmuramoyl-L-alanine amidase [Pseudomonadota bacterium]